MRYLEVMSMKKISILVGLILACLMMIGCEEPVENVIGSRDHEINVSETETPEILANGISTLRIVATVYDKNGEPARGMKVAFRTTPGKINEFAITDWDGQTVVTLTSVASNTDLIAEVTATVLDTAFQSMPKQPSSRFTVSVHTPDFNEEHQKRNFFKKHNQLLDNNATIYVKFIGVTLSAEVEEAVLPADGFSETKVSIRLRETSSQKAIANEEVRIGIKYGMVLGNARTNEQGIADINLKAADKAGEDTLNVEYGNKLATYKCITYVTPNLTLTAKASRVPADGESRIQIIATLLMRDTNNPIANASIRFFTSAGIIQASAITNKFGQANVDLIAGTTPDSQVVVVAKFLELSDSVTVAFISALATYPNSIVLDAEPNFIWVRETGNLEQTTVSATILGVTGQPVGNDFKVKFSIINGPGGGEVIEPSSGSDVESSLVNTIDGRAEAYIRAGIRSGTVQIRAELVDYPQIAAQTSNIVIRSGPAYIWIDPANVNKVIPHTMLIVEIGKHNVAFANPVQDIQVTAILGDKYNNPIEKGTAVYFTTTGGIITTDAITNEKGQATVILQDCYPFPYLITDDANQLSASNIPNPNDANVILDVTIPDFEGSVIQNSLGTFTENDGVAVLLAYTWGQDQNGNLVKVWTGGLVVFSSAIHTFTAVSDKSELGLGEYATIDIRLFDVHGNPVAAGSRLTVSSTKGKVTEANLLPAADKYGYGKTFFWTQLQNDLDPEEDESTTAIVTIELDSPNGCAKINVPIFLRVGPP